MKQPAFTPFGPERASVAATDADDEPGERLLEGNQADLFDHTEDVRAALIGTLERAVDHINLDAALLHTPGLGADIIGCLGEQCRKGVRVQVIAHTLDMARATDELSRLCEAGITLNEDHPRRGWRGWLDRRLRATHRQLAVVDGEVAWCGPGIRSPDLCSFGPHVRMRGPVVQRLQRLFLEAWHASSSAARLPQANYFPPLIAVGRARMGLSAAPATGGVPLQAGHSLVEQIEKARAQVFVSMVERAPSRRLMKALLAASASGVGVTVVVHRHALGWRWQERCADLLSVGARVYRVDDSCPFPCHAVVDGHWSSLAVDGPRAKVGEGAELIVMDTEFAASLEAVFHQATGHAVQLHEATVPA
ncbi:MAG: phospholipase D-like domain-containing protein [Hydrogenophaga sp.]|uniref:phospholipase D-like domain-containing protein n=1 Tax=Hydrogenophaga sp. TaxID=1904254 RepID=UPI0040371AF8